MRARGRAAIVAIVTAGCGAVVADAPVDASGEVARDTSAPHVTVDVSAPETSVDVSAPETSVDVGAPETSVDASVIDAMDVVRDARTAPRDVAMDAPRDAPAVVCASGDPCGGRCDGACVPGYACAQYLGGMYQCVSLPVACGTALDAGDGCTGACNGPCAGACGYGDSCESFGDGPHVCMPGGDFGDPCTSDEQCASFGPAAPAGWVYCCSSTNDGICYQAMGTSCHPGSDASTDVEPSECTP